MARLRSSTAAAVVAGGLGLLLGGSIFVGLDSWRARDRDPSAVEGGVERDRDGKDPRDPLRGPDPAPIEAPREPREPVPVPAAPRVTVEEVPRSRASRDEDPSALGAKEVLRYLAQGSKKPPRELVADAKHFESYFAPRHVGPDLAGPELSGDGTAEIEPGATIHFPAGVHLVTSLTFGVRDLPPDVTIAGAGMDVTLLVQRQDLHVAQDLERFTLRDCTIYTGDNYLMDLRGQTLGIFRLLRTRVIGFDMAAGSSCALGIKASLVHAVESFFEGGYGRHPGSGRLLDVRTSALLARFDRCLFSRIQIGYSRDGVVLFAGCTFEEMLAEPGPVLLEDCEYTRREPLEDSQAEEHALRRDLKQLFPAWEAR